MKFPPRYAVNCFHATVAAVVLIMATTREARSQIIPSSAYFVTPGLSLGGNPGALYNSASITIAVDPARTEWIAWNDTDAVVIPDSLCQGGFCLNSHRFGTDDFIRLTVTNLSNNDTATFDIDQNNGSGTSFGIQNVIFGDAATAPDSLREVSITDSTKVLFDDPGSHNSIFTTSADYRFDFEFRNIGGPAGHPDIWLLVDVVPEPTTCTLALSALFLAMSRRRRT